jgi:alanine racemase
LVRVAAGDNVSRDGLRAVKSWGEVSGARLAENFRAVQAVAGVDVEALAVVKANGYGHGAEICAPVLAAAGAGWLGVTDVVEGIAVRAALANVAPATRIIVLCGMEPADAPELVTNGLTPMVWTAAQVSAMDRAARQAGQRVAVHLEIETGMARQGVEPGEPLARIVEQILASENIFCEGVATHLACSEVAGALTTQTAQRRFGEALNQVIAAGLRPAFVHLGNSSAVDEGSTMAWVRGRARAMTARAMIRSGLAVYGYCLPLEGAGADAARLRPRVQPVLTWKAPVIGVRDVAAGATVGYGATFVAQHPMRLALLPVGYADGFRREASSGLGDGWVMVLGRRAAVVGRVSMNLTVVDVTGIDGVVEGTEAVLLGEGVSVEDHARWAGTIPYEILCGIRARLALV